MKVNFGIIFFLTVSNRKKKKLDCFPLEINFWHKFASSIEILKDIVFLKSQVLFHVKGEEKPLLLLFWNSRKKGKQCQCPPQAKMLEHHLFKGLAFERNQRLYTREHTISSNWARVSDPVV